ncbi:radical SAM protein [Rivihabitans pingtungensis]|uniref:radical SAM protein n=1 Tax=Rivihabitans pingtungensis TaxID=1054498 RepID=UPI0023548911|nr:radical SAM protein [Rivihabitans pingtungensis]MCK6437433.1 radical SAM protein [Rivihabitans pingtungensis]
MSFFNGPKHICWDITSACNESCRFCYRVTDQRDLSLTDHFKIAEKLAVAGVRKVSIVGGEPLLVDHLPQLLKYMKSRGVSTSVVTNGILLQKCLKSLDGCVDWITLPLDGHNDSTQVAMSRISGHFERVMRLAPLVLESGFRLKINSVVSLVNYHDVQKLSECVATIGPDRWKLFEFSPIRGVSLINSIQFSLLPKAFRKAVESIEMTVKSKGIHVTLADRDYLNSNYFSVSPNGDVRITVDSKDYIVGNLLNSNVADIWQHSPYDHARHWALRESLPESFYTNRLVTKV